MSSLNTDKVTAAILVGGESRRMGEDKSLVELHGRPLVAHVYSVVSKVFSDIIISAHREDYQAPKELNDLKIVADSTLPEFRELRGPALGLLSALMAEEKNEWVFLVSCDVPLISEEIIRYMTNCIDEKNNKYDAIVPEVSERLQPTFALYNKSILPLLSKRLKEGRSGLVSLLKNDSDIKVLYIHEKKLTELGLESTSLMDIDTPEELRELSDTFRNKEQ